MVSISMRFTVVLFLFVSLTYINKGYAQSTVALQTEKPWNAKWIAAPNDNGENYGVYYFRKTIDFLQSPNHLLYICLQITVTNCM